MAPASFKGVGQPGPGPWDPVVGHGGVVPASRRTSKRQDRFRLWASYVLGSAMLLATFLELLDLAFSRFRPRASRPRIAESASDKAFGPLRFSSDGTFQISIFEDLHFGENAWDSWGPQQDINSVKVMGGILDAEPDIGLVVLNGDLITGENTFRENSTHYIDQIVGPMVERGLTWASTYGNHDSDYNISRVDILAREQRWSNARTTQMISNDHSGVSNYYLPVYDNDCETASDCTPELLLWFFDSRGGHKYQQKDEATGDLVGEEGWVDKSVVDWFQKTHKQILNRTGRVIPSLAFVHIPTNASLAFQDSGVDSHRQPGINDDKPLAQQAQGWCSDGVNNGTCPYGGQDVPFMSAITSTPGLMALFSGHDHGDTWCYKWDRRLPGMKITGNGINLCFGQRSGYGGYGSWVRGARQVVVSQEQLEDLALDTYIRLETGDIVGSVTLNSTYGRDRYPATPDDETSCPTCVY